jgi:DNA-binding Lrp family transcriptional regulator
MVLKPQDVYVVLKLAALKSDRPSYAQLAQDLVMSASEVHASVQRAQKAGLLHGPARNHQPNRLALEEFLVHGLRYAFPPDRGEITRGIPTWYAAEPLSRLITQGSDPVPVWPYVEGTVRGMSLAPLYRTAPMAALRDPALYEYLALVDALRAGRARERTLAAEELHRRLWG